MRFGRAATVWVSAGWLVLLALMFAILVVGIVGGVIDNW